jgi:hypothetical protein
MHYTTKEKDILLKILDVLLCISLKVRNLDLIMVDVFFLYPAPYMKNDKQITNM